MRLAIGDATVFFRLVWLMAVGKIDLLLGGLAQSSRADEGRSETCMMLGCSLGHQIRERPLGYGNGVHKVPSSWVVDLKERGAGGNTS